MSRRRTIIVAAAAVLAFLVGLVVVGRVVAPLLRGLP